MKNFDDLIDIMYRLRRECPWDKKQTAESLRQYILEESYEVIESIDQQDWAELSKELGDLLLQIVFQSTIAEEHGHFKLANVIDNINQKMVERHPHVFAKTKVENADDVANNWEHIKMRTEKRDSLLSGVPFTAPALMRAQRVQEKASRVGFDWNRPEQVLEKLEEELGELKAAIAAKDRDGMEEEIGDLLFSMVNLSRFINIVAEDALRLSTSKFMERFKFIESHFNNNYQKMADAGLEELDRLWNEAKRKKNA